MDVLLSLPIISYFAAPALTSWSTSLNLLFFYMTWMTLVLSHSPLKIELVSTLAVRLVLWLAPSLLFLLFDTGVPSLSESIKLYGTTSLPPRRAKLLLRQLLLAIVNLLLVTAVQAGLSLGASALFLRGRPLFRTTTTLPLPWQIIKHIGLLYAAREVLTYYIHRGILHRGRGLPARLHARYAHGPEHRGAPFSLLLYADHPLALVLHRLVPAYAPALAVRPHLLTYLLFTVLTTLEDTLALSGYSVVPGIIMSGIARRTAAHYASGGRGNFGAWGLLDWLSGTSIGRGVVEDLQDEAHKHQLRERGEKAADDAGSLIQDGIDGLKKGRKGGKKKN
jgi:hypothetical protein